MLNMLRRDFGWNYKSTELMCMESLKTLCKIHQRLVKQTKDEYMKRFTVDYAPEEWTMEQAIQLEKVRKMYNDKSFEFIIYKNCIQRGITPYTFGKYLCDQIISEVSLIAESDLKIACSTKLDMIISAYLVLADMSIEEFARKYRVVIHEFNDQKRNLEIMGFRESENLGIISKVIWMYTVNERISVYKVLRDYCAEVNRLIFKVRRFMEVKENKEVV